MKKKLLMISLDAFGDEDLAFARTLPTFQKLLHESAQVTGVKTVYPSLTYMAHTSILTGMLPKDHGVLHNTHIQPKSLDPDWYWYANEIKVPTLFDVAKKHGYTTGALLWPVMGGNRSLDYNIAEIYPNKKWQTQVGVSLKVSTPSYLLAMNQKFGKIRNGIEQPQLDDFVTAVAVETIRTKKPDVFAIHLVDLDSMRHQYGVQSNQAKEAIVRMDGRLKQIFDVMEEAGVREDTVVAVFGDHYQIDTHTVIRPNYLFQDRGWLKTNKKNEILEAKIYCKAADGAAYIYRNDETITNKMILDALKGIDARIERIYSAEETESFGADPKAALMIEAKKGYYFASDIQYPFMETTEKTLANRSLLKATHGFHPDRSHYTTMFLLSGPGVDTSARLSSARLVDEGPTLLHAIGLRFENATEGHVLTEIFE